MLLSPKTDRSFPRIPKTHKRLLGTWKSDDKRTKAEWSWKNNLPPKKRKPFESILGKFGITHTRTKIISKLRHRKWPTSQRHKILGMDEQSVAIIRFGDLKVRNRRRYDPELLQFTSDVYQNPKIEHLHFTGRHY